MPGTLQCWGNTQRVFPEYCVLAGIRLEKENEEIEIEDRILRDIKNVFRLEKENEVIKDIMLRDIRKLFEDEEERSYFKQVRVCIFFPVTIILNMKVTMITIKHY